MPSKSPILYPNQSKLLKAFGQRLKAARLLRRFPLSLVAERVDVSRQTITKVEQGNPSVTFGTYIRVMAVLGQEKDINLLATNDRLAKMYLEHGIDVAGRKRAPKKIKPKTVEEQQGPK